MTVVADVRSSDDLERLFISARIEGQTTELSFLLRAADGGLRPRRTAQGLAIPGVQAPHLLQGAPGTDLRWTEEALRYAENRQDGQRRHERFRRAVTHLAGLPRAELEGRLPAIEGIERLHDHQVLNVAAMVDPDCVGLCLFDEQGAGKTVSVIYAWDALSALDLVDFGLVIAPKSMVPEWAEDFRRFRGDLYSLVVAAGGRREKLAALRAAPDLLITNFETAVTLENELTAHLRRLDRRGLLVVDESFFVKNRGARRTRALRRLREWCGRAFVLCGTPAPNAATDVIEQFNLADFGIAFSGVEIPEGPMVAQAVVNTTLKERGAYLRSLKRDVLPELPTKSFDVVRLELAPVQRGAYEAALVDLILDLRRSSDSDFARRLGSFMARRAALLQICSNPVRVLPGYEETPAKLTALDGLLKRWVVEDQEKVVVWSSYRASLEAIEARYRPLGLVRYDGSVTDVAERREAVRSFQEDQAVRVFVANPAAAGAGLTLHAARTAIYESLTNQAAHYLQSLDRVHRRGQVRDVRYVVLLAGDTIEEAEYAALKRKERSAQELLGDPVDAAPTRTAMLLELTGSAQRLGVRPEGVP